MLVGATYAQWVSRVSKNTQSILVGATHAQLVFRVSRVSKHMQKLLMEAAYAQ